MDTATLTQATGITAAVLALTVTPILTIGFAALRRDVRAANQHATKELDRLQPQMVEQIKHQLAVRETANTAKRELEQLVAQVAGTPYHRPGRATAPKDGREQLRGEGRPGTRPHGLDGRTARTRTHTAR